MNTSVKDLKGQLSFIGINNVASYFSVFSEKMKSHFYKSSRRNSYDALDDKPGQFLFMMRSIMIRHAIQMKSRAEGRSIMTLPPKVSFSHLVCFVIDCQSSLIFHLILSKGGNNHHNNFRQERTCRILETREEGQGHIRIN